MPSRRSEPLLTTSDVADRLRVSEQTVRRWVYDGDLDALRLGHRTLRFEPFDVDRFIEQRRVR